MPASPVTRFVRHRGAALRVAARRTTWREALTLDFSRMGFAVPLRVGVAVALVFVIGGLTDHQDVAGFAALGALVAAFCRPDPYPTRVGRLIMLAAGVTVSIAIGAAVAVWTDSLLLEIAVICLLGGVAAYMMSLLHIVGPGAVVFVFAAAGAAGFAADLGDFWRAIIATAIGGVIGVVASLAPWLLRLAPADDDGPARESLWRSLTRFDRQLLFNSARITLAGALAAALALATGLSYPLWAAMGAVAAMQGVGYHLTVRRGVQRLLGNVAGGVLAAALLALPLGYWGAVVAIIIFQTLAEIFSTVNYALCSVAVTPMALLLTGLTAGLSPITAIDRVLDTLIGIVVGIVVAAITISGTDSAGLRPDTLEPVPSLR